MDKVQEYLQLLPLDIRTGIEPLRLSEHDTLLVLSTYKELVRYGELGLILYEYRESTGRVYNIDNFKRQEQKLQADYQKLSPFIYCLKDPFRENDYNQPILSIPHPSSILKSLENKLPKDELSEALSALTGKKRLESRTDIEKLINEEILKPIEDVEEFIKELTSKNSK